jgi:serine phosphatase RsbU (regulator of sigma subunit)
MMQAGEEAVVARPAGLPVPPPGPAVPAAAAAAEPTHADWLIDPKRLLLVEDDAGDALLVEELLSDSNLGATLTWARTLGEAKQLLASGEGPGCVLLDLRLPDADGLQAVTQVLAVAPETPVIVLTGLAEENAGLAAVAAGAQDYLIKGQSSPEVFGRAIRYAAQRKHVEQASAALQVSSLQAAENARLERGLLPTPLLHTGRVKVVARYLPGREHGLLAGDFYDVVETSDGSVHAVLGDVSGHGAAEAAIGVCLRVAWRALVLAGTSVATLLPLLEQILVAERSGEQDFATLTHLTMPPERDRVRFVRAGHPGLLLRGPGGVELIEGTVGPALGMVPGPGWQQDELPLPAGAHVVLFTDGLFEGRTGPGNQRLGEEGLLALARTLAPEPAAAFVDGLVEQVEAAAAPYGGLADDVAVLHIGWAR